MITHYCTAWETDLVGSPLCYRDTVADALLGGEWRSVCEKHRSGDQFRETVAKTLGEAWITSGPRSWEEQSEGRRVGARLLADAVIALPEVRHLMSAGGAVREVRELADRLEEDARTGEYKGGSYAVDVLRDVAVRIRRSLDGFEMGSS